MQLALVHGLRPALPPLPTPPPPTSAAPAAPLPSRNVLDILRNNSRLEALYSMAAARACQVRPAKMLEAERQGPGGSRGLPLATAAGAYR